MQRSIRTPVGIFGCALQRREAYSAGTGHGSEFVVTLPVGTLLPEPLRIDNQPVRKDPHATLNILGGRRQSGCRRNLCNTARAVWARREDGRYCKGSLRAHPVVSAGCFLTLAGIFANRTGTAS